MHINKNTSRLSMVLVAGCLLAAQAQAIVVTAHPIVIARPVIVARPAPVTPKVTAPVVKAMPAAEAPAAKPAAAATKPEQAKPLPAAAVPMVVPHTNTSSDCDDTRKKSKNNTCKR